MLFRCMEIVCLLLFTVLVYSSTFADDYGKACNETQTCDQPFICRHLQGCLYGKCICNDGFVYNFTNATCGKEKPPAPLPGYKENCTSDCAGNLVCKHCEYDEYPFAQTVCRTASLALKGESTGNLTSANKCLKASDCGPTLDCYKSVDCDAGKCKCKPGFTFAWPDKPCIKKKPPSEDIPLGSKCFPFGQHKCVNGTTCSQCPGAGFNACIGVPYAHKIHPFTTEAPGPRDKTSPVNIAVYIIVPLLVGVVMAIVIAVVVRKRRISRAGFSDFNADTPKLI